MAESKGQGLTFAEKQLLCHGWEHGKGLGRAENGISEAIKVKVKSDKAGVGHKEGDQFTFHWWDHVFNKASSSLQVETDPSGVQLKKNVDSDKDVGLISNRKPLKASFSKEKLYGCFVKSATLLSGQEQPEPKSTSDDDSSSEDEDNKLDLSSTTNLSDADLMVACGGRTAHKGARYGLTMSAKLARLEQQEAAFMAKYGKKNQSSGVQSADREEEPAEDSTCKMVKKKKNKRQSVEDELHVSAEAGEICAEETTKKRKKKKVTAEQIEEEPEKTKKKKRSKQQSQLEEREMEPTQSELQDCATKIKKKKSKRK